MKLITILFLCSRLLLSLSQEVVSQEVDCDDEDVFQAVDAALKKYNIRNQTGNHFVLYRITEATKMVGSETFYSLKYQIKEGDCSVQSTKSWQDCDYKMPAVEAATGECTATVGKRSNNKFSVATQTCKITPGTEGSVVTAQYTCLGCVHPISTDSPELEPVLRHAIQHFNNNTEHSHLFALGEVKKARRQVVAGWNFELTYTIVQTNCSKKNFLFLTPDCKSLLNGDVGECTDNTYMNPELKIAAFSQNCDLYPGEDLVQPLPKHCPGCPREIPVDSPELKEALTHSILKLNAENNSTFYFKIETVKRATSQVVGGQKFYIEFTARETTCSKESNTELTEACEINSLGQSLSCSANVYMRLWENKIFPTVNCQPLDMNIMMRRPPGFSPFRAVKVQETNEGTTVSSPYTSMVPDQEEQDAENEQVPNHGHGQFHKKHTKHGIDHHGHQKGLGLGHGQQPKLKHILKHQRGHGLGHEHEMEHDLSHKHRHGRGHGKHKNKDKSTGKLSEQKAEHWASSSEDSPTASAQIQEATKGPTLRPPLAWPGETVTSSSFQDSDLIEAGMPHIAPSPTELSDDWIPDIRIEPDSLSFKVIPDFPETTSPRCPGRPWKAVSEENPTTQMKEYDDFDLSDALS
uniref:Cystatin kininogen-type domain-containing protein n=1 Tax=Jaculus jaculus TaxID=51337 RepID=A0A8C5KJ11_JACJA